eukprot:CAMPEP_0184498616 /NCGR_PEP_ID=MMETSP0113_2-20130426/39418_1 /TAXON_ID=91329 /ORGANISM="Norrisiella sphaerica, Strain BC52" /LENGTH=520 /DNA_ID=CAMNT_0026886213 /DNA_START=30 /DNA_END=1592 /DNA_ORIENTATION=-
MEDQRNELKSPVAIDPRYRHRLKKFKQQGNHRLSASVRDLKMKGGTPRRTPSRGSSGIVSHPRAKSDNLSMFREYKSTSSSPASSLYSDRFIPSRSGSNLENAFDIIDTKVKKTTQPLDPQGTNYSALLRKEILGTSDPESQESSKKYKNSGRSRTFRFKTPKKAGNPANPYSMSPVCNSPQGLLYTPRKTPRKIAKSPFKVLDAPSLKDDFYLNLVDWSGLNVLAVGLGQCAYLWSACTSKVTKLCDLSNVGDSITSVAWTQRGQHLAVGTQKGEVQIWDSIKCKRIRTMSGHQYRVGTIAWNSTLLASGSRDRLIFLRDYRVREHHIKKLEGHKQEVCGLKWSFDERQLASGGNDNKLLIWNAQSSTPIVRFNEHGAAVKAIAWSPHQHGLLASGGGTADRCIRFWNTLTGTALSHVDTGSQVCNLMWSKNVNEIVSTHGYSLNQIIVWKYPAMQKLATLTGHTFRVLYLAISPDGQTIVTGAGDETLRFWNVFPTSKSKSSSQLGSRLFFPSATDIR